MESNKYAAICKNIREKKVDHDVITSESEKRIWKESLLHFELREDEGYYGRLKVLTMQQVKDLLQPAYYRENDKHCQDAEYL